MEIFRKIRSLLGLEKKSEAYPPVRLDANGLPWLWEAGYIGNYTFSSYSMREFVLNGYAKNPFVFMCADKIASVSAQLDWQIKDGNGRVLDNARVKEAVAMLERPNPMQTWDDFYYEVIVSLMVTGNVFIRKEEAIGFTEPGAYKVLVPYLVDIYTTGVKDDGPILYYTYDGEVVQVEEIIHIKYSNLIERTHWGFSKLQPGLAAYEASNNIFESEAHLHKNLGITGVLSNKNGDMPMLPEEQKKLQSAWNNANAGPSNFGRIMVTTAALDYLKLGMSPEDLQTLEGQRDKMRYICSLFGLDSSLFNDPENKTFANRATAEVSMYESVIKPVTEKVNRALSAEILRGIYGLMDAVIVADFDSIAVLMEAKAESRRKLQQELSQAIDSGLITKQEARAKLYPDLGEMPVEDAEVQDANALAQAQLRGSVGGAQALLSVQVAVAAGEITRDAAMGLLKYIYGFTEAEASEIIGR